MPSTEFCPFLTNSEGLSSEMIFAIQFPGVIAVIGVGEQIHPGPVVEYLESDDKLVIKVFIYKTKTSNKM